MSRYVERSSRWTPPRGRLPSLNVELTERCDNRCVHCCINRPMADPEALARETTTPRLMRLLDEAAALGCLQLRFTGGEPLLRDDFPDLYLHARRLGMRVIVFTNGRRITPELANLFSRIPPLLPIEVSVYGMTRRSYEAVTRAPGSHAEFRRGLAELGQRRIPHVVKWVVLPANLNELDAFRAWAATIPGMTGTPAEIAALQLRSRRDCEEQNRAIAALRLDPTRWGALLAGEDSSSKAERLDFCRRFLGPKDDRLFPCGFGDAPCLDAYGRLQPCLSMRAPETTYDLDQGTIAAAMTEFFPSIRGGEARNPEYRQRCARCFLMGLCNQCPAWSWTEHGTLDTPVDYLCRIAHAQARMLGLLREGENGWETEDWRDRLRALTCLN